MLMHIDLTVFCERNGLFELDQTCFEFGQVFFYCDLVWLMM